MKNIKKFNENINSDIPTLEQYTNLCYSKMYKKWYANLETGETMTLSDIKERYEWLLKNKKTNEN